MTVSDSAAASLHRDLGRAGGEVGVPRDRLGGGEQLAHGAGGQRLADRLRALGEETPGVAAARAVG